MAHMKHSHRTLRVIVLRAFCTDTLCVIDVCVLSYSHLRVRLQVTGSGVEGGGEGSGEDDEDEEDGK